MSCDGDLGKSFSNTSQNVGLGILNFFGVGDFIKNASGWKTPLDKLKEQVGQIQQQTEDFRDSANIKLFKVQEEINGAILAGFHQSNNLLEDEIKSVQEILQEEISLNQIYIIFIYLLFLVLYIFYMLSK